jgi:uncharacterized membrane protein YccF (DUF307 family)
MTHPPPPGPPFGPPPGPIERAQEGGPPAPYPPPPAQAHETDISPAPPPVDQNHDKNIPPPDRLGTPGSALRVVGNILWLLLSGLWMAIAYVVAGVLMFVTIIGIPFGIQAFKLAGFSLWPFGRMMVKKRQTRTGSLLGNVLWFIFAGFWLALAHLASALVFAITIVGIPFAIVSVRLAEAALVPFGREVVPLAEGRNRTP